MAHQICRKLWVSTFDTIDNWQRVCSEGEHTVTLPYIGPLSSLRMKRKTKAGINVKPVMPMMYFHSSLRSVSVSYRLYTIKKTLTAMTSVHSTSATGNLKGQGH